MLHVLLALYTITFTMGMAVIVLSLLAFARFSSRSFRQLAILIAASLLLMLVDMLKVYERAVAGGIGVRLIPLYVVLAAVGFGTSAYAAPALALEVTRRPVSLPLRVLNLSLVALLAVLGFFRELEPGLFTTPAAIIGLLGVEAYGVGVLGVRLKRIENPHVRALVRDGIVLVPVMLVAVLGQVLVQALPKVPAFLRDFPVTQIAFLLVVESVLLGYGLRYLFAREPAPACLLPDSFVDKYSISPRECEIVSMIVQGYGNRLIAEKLFISAMTVKNHIYHIYQKTGAVNKIQLVNIINSLK